MSTLDGDQRWKRAKIEQTEYWTNSRSFEEFSYSPGKDCDRSKMHKCLIRAGFYHPEMDGLIESFIETQFMC